MPIPIPIPQQLCANCHRPLEMDPKGRAPHKRFCTGACRRQFHNAALTRRRRAARAAAKATKPTG